MPTRNNTFYLGTKRVNLLNIHDADIVFDGNTYAAIVKDALAIKTERRCVWAWICPR